MKKNYLLALICFLSFTEISLSQITHSWRSPQATNGNWEVINNWWSTSAGGTIPFGNDILRFNNNHEVTMTNDLRATNRYQIFFDAGATTSRTINGVTENIFYDFGSNNPKIENSSTSLHTINFPIKIGHSEMEINPVNGDFTFGGNVNLDNKTLKVYGDNNKVLTFNGVVSGTGNVRLEQNTKIVFNGINTYTGYTYINNGDLEVNAGIATSSIQIEGDGSLVVNTDLTIPSLTLGDTSATATVTIKAGKSLTITGDLKNNTPNAIILEHGASLIVGGTVMGNTSITYKLNVADTNWHLISSPVVGEQYDDAYITANSIASGVIAPSNRGIATYNNGTADATTKHWRYFQAGGTATTFDSGVGYSLKRTASGTYTFTGNFPTTDVTPAISQSDNNWNLIGNPYPAYIDIAALITANTSNLDTSFQSIYVWNASTSSYDDLQTGSIHPGQAFFINSSVATGNASITKAMQSHQTGQNFYKSSNPSIDLSVSDGASTKTTQVNYLDTETKGLDPGFDIGMFDGVSSDLSVYTHLIDDNKGISFVKQALPNSDLESMVIPLGVKADAGKEITFSAKTLNLPTNIKLFIEDKVSNTFTRLDETNNKYKVTSANAINGVGRFYLHTTKSVLSVKDIALNSVSIFKTNTATIRITGLPHEKTTFSLFNILGKQIITTSFEANGIKDISLPKLTTGIYFVNMQTETGKISKKIVLE